MVSIALIFVMSFVFWNLKAAVIHKIFDTNSSFHVE